MTQRSLGSLDIAIRLSLLASAATAMTAATGTLGAHQARAQAIGAMHAQA